MKELKSRWSNPEFSTKPWIIRLGTCIYNYVTLSKFKIVGRPLHFSAPSHKIARTVETMYCMAWNIGGEFNSVDGQVCERTAKLNSANDVLYACVWSARLRSVHQIIIHQSCEKIKKIANPPNITLSNNYFMPYCISLQVRQASRLHVADHLLCGAKFLDPLGHRFALSAFSSSSVLTFQRDMVSC